MNNKLKDTKIFVVGNPRSGTTMLGRILGNNPLVYTLKKELHFFGKHWIPHTANPTLSLPEAIDFACKLFNSEQNSFYFQGDNKVFYNEAENFIKKLSNDKYTLTGIYKNFLKYIVKKNGRIIPCEHTPGYVYNAEEILDLFPNARIINIIRDPRDVLLSRKNKWKQYSLNQEKIHIKKAIRQWVHYHPLFTSIIWKAAVKTASTFDKHKQVYSVRFVDILKNPEYEIRRICTFIGISYSSDMLKIPMKGSSFIEDQSENNGINKTRIGNWRQGGLNSAELYIIQKITQKTMIQCGYKPIRKIPNPFLLIFYLMTLPVKMFISFFFQWKHFKSIKGTIKERLL